MKVALVLEKVALVLHIMENNMNILLPNIKGVDGIHYCLKNVLKAAICLILDLATHVLKGGKYKD